MFLRYNVLPILWAVLIYILSVIPAKALPEIDLWHLVSVDKLAHLFMYAMLAFLLSTGLKRQYSSAWIRYHAKLTSFWVSCLYGFLLEIIQLVLKGDRYFDLFDVAANCIGAAIGIVSFMLIFGKELNR